MTGPLTASALRQEGPQQEQQHDIRLMTDYQIVEVLKARAAHDANDEFGRWLGRLLTAWVTDSPLADIDVILSERAALSASRTAQAPQQDAYATRQVEKLREAVPQLYGEAIQRWPWLTCEPHEWDNRTTEENAIWLIAASHARIQVLETSVDYLRNLIDHPVQQQEQAKDIAAIVSSYGWLLMRLAVTSDPQDTYDVCKREFDTHQPALKRLQDTFLHNQPESVEDWIVREARAISGPRTHLQDSEALIQFGLRVAKRCAAPAEGEALQREK